MEDAKKQNIINNMGKHLIRQLEGDLRRKFAAWNKFAHDGVEEMEDKPEKLPHMPVEVQVVTMKVADGQLFDRVGWEDMPTDGGVPMKIEVSDPYFVEFKNAILPDDGTPEYTPVEQIPALIKAILSEHPKSVGFLHTAESWVHRGQNPLVNEDYSSEEALVVTFQGIDGSVLTGVLPIALDDSGIRYLKPLEFATPLPTGSGQ